MTLRGLRVTSRHAGNEVNGVVCVDKPLGLSSNAALQRVRKALGAAKAGHTGTLDPLATGLLPICLGDATKFSRFFLDADKTYLATMRLGITTTTGDREGDTLSHGEVPPELEEGRLRELCTAFAGLQSQVPPMYSALKVGGTPLYKLARSGQTVERKSRSVTIQELEIIQVSLPDLTFRVRCSKGTYVRTLAEDMGTWLGCGAHLVALRRTASGSFNIDAAAPLPDRYLELDSHGVPGERTEKPLAIFAAEIDVLRSAIHPVDVALEQYQRVDLDSSQSVSLIHGKEVTIPGRVSLTRELQLTEAGESGELPFRAYGLDTFLGLVYLRPGEDSISVINCRLVNTAELVRGLSV